ncbi:MAG: glycosyltransferase family 4 protein [Elusimicrobiota bacterium]|nr:glycosyltransferase family 4 protein [Elusimicrobiota bacterium]
MKRYNILYVANSGEIIGGGEISLLELLSKLNKERFHPIVVCPYRGDLAEEVEKLNIEVKIIPMTSLKKFNFYLFVYSIDKIIKILKENNISLVHTNGSRCTIYSGIACKITKTPIIWHVRILESDGLLDRFLAKISTLIIVNSNAVKKRFYWLTNKNKIEVVYNGIDLPKFNEPSKSQDIRNNFHIDTKRPLITTIGRLDWYKAHEYLLRSVKIVKESIPNVLLLLVGDGDRKEYLKNLSKQLRIDENVIFTGKRKDIDNILHASDLFVLSSVSEGFGRSAVEAMACRKPVVATKVGGLSEVVKDGITGRLVQPRNPQALAKAIIEILLDKRKAENMGIAGRKRTEELFSIERNVNKTQEIYERLITEIQK